MNQQGGICNGITSDSLNELAPSFMPYAITDWRNWRWIEQWLPHDAWYLLAVSKMDELNPINNLDCANQPRGKASYDKCNVCSGGSTGIPVDDCLITGTNKKVLRELTVYPNPATNVVSVSGEFSNWKLVSLTGIVLQEGANSEIEINTLEKGVYILLVDEESFKVIKN